MGFDFDGLALLSEHFCILDLHGAVYVVIFMVTSFSLPFRELSLLELALDLVD